MIEDDVLCKGSSKGMMDFKKGETKRIDPSLEYDKGIVREAHHLVNQYGFCKEFPVFLKGTD